MALGRALSLALLSLSLVAGHDAASGPSKPSPLGTRGCKRSGERAEMRSIDVA